MLQNVHPSCKELQILLFFSNNFNVLQTNELDNSEQVAADLIDLLKQSAPASPFRPFENNQYNALQVLAEIFKVSLDYTSIEHQLQQNKLRHNNSQPKTTLHQFQGCLYQSLYLFQQCIHQPLLVPRVNAQQYRLYPLHNKNHHNIVTTSLQHTLTMAITQTNQ